MTPTSSAGTSSAMQTKSQAEATLSEHQAEERRVWLIEQLLVKNGQTESTQIAMKRDNAIQSIRSLFSSFVQKHTSSLPHPSTGSLRTFGSVCIGVSSDDSDVDAVCIAPNAVSRKMFFTLFADELRASTEVSSLVTILEAFVPVITLVYDDIEIDLVFAQLHLDTVLEDVDISNDNLLKNLDDRCVRSLNGPRVANEILRLVPNHAAYRTALRFVKYWAKQRGVYSNILGYLGGVAWAISVAKICQMHPTATADFILSEFFSTLMKWDWTYPMILKPIQEDPWNPVMSQIYPDTFMMPIITPAYPSMCTTHNLSKSNFNLIMHEITRGATIVERISAGTGSWEQLVEPLSFRSLYEDYLQIVATSDSFEHQFVWSGWVESRIRQLSKRLETLPNVSLVHICTQVYEKVIPQLPTTESPANHSDQSVTHPSSLAHSSVFYIGLQLAENFIPARGIHPSSVLDVSRPIQEFIELVQSGTMFSPDIMGISVRHLNGADIPSEHCTGYKHYKKRRRAISGTKLHAEYLQDEEPEVANETVTLAPETQALDPNQDVPIANDQPFLEAPLAQPVNVVSSGVLFIGGLDLAVTEFRLKKIFEKFGQITKLDFLWHKTGPKIGHPKGSAFVKFENESSSLRAIATLNGTVPAWNGGRRLTVTWSKLTSQQASQHSGTADANSTQHPTKRPKTKREFEARALEATINKKVQLVPGSNSTPETRIAAIERKLKEMESKKAAAADGGSLCNDVTAGAKNPSKARVSAPCLNQRAKSPATATHVSLSAQAANSAAGTRNYGPQHDDEMSRDPSLDGDMTANRGRTEKNRRAGLSNQRGQ
ncbi:polynucleotide adenylyltransferase [Chytriomyces hyalinus]|nr:polynucleotide adenylyltransferase [Chytriomyces hyalinus]